jgi:hypothetical protein
MHPQRRAETKRFEIQRNNLIVIELMLISLYVELVGCVLAVSQWLSRHSSWLVWANWYFSSNSSLSGKEFLLFARDDVQASLAKFKAITESLDQFVIIRNVNLVALAIDHIE